MRTEAASCIREKPHRGGQDRLSTVESSHRLDDPVEGDQWHPDDCLHVVVPILWAALHFERRGTNAVLFGCSLICPIWGLGHHSCSL